MAAWTPAAGGPNAIMIDVMQSTPGYFAAMGIPLIAGRDFAWSDRVDGERVVIVDETFVRQAWPDGTAIGRTLTLDDKRSATVVGIVRHARQYRLDADDRPHVYQPYSQVTQSQMTLAVRTNGDPERLAEMRGSMLALARPDAADVIADELLALARRLG